jgi:hypothetical protein
MKMILSFTVGCICGYLIRKNWYLLNQILGNKSVKTNKQLKDDIKKNDTPIDETSKVNSEIASTDVIMTIKF